MKIKITHNGKVLLENYSFVLEKEIEFNRGQSMVTDLKHGIKFEFSFDAKAERQAMLDLGILEDNGD
jgi:hypothetical protein